LTVERSVPDLVSEDVDGLVHPATGKVDLTMLVIDAIESAVDGHKLRVWAGSVVSLHVGHGERMAVGVEIRVC